MKSFFEFYKLMEAEGVLPPPPSSAGGTQSQPQAKPQQQASTQQGSAPVAPTANKVPPSSGVSAPVNEPTKEAKDEILTELRPMFEKFFKDKFQPFLNKHTMTKDQAMVLIGTVVKEIAQQAELSGSQVKQGVSGGMTTNSEPVSPPQKQPQAAG